jgi:hypothetical protein
MALIEVDEGELRKLAAERDSYKPSKMLLDKLGSNPKTRTEILRLMKEANPDLVIPEIDAAKPVLDELGRTREQVAALQKRLDDDAAEREKQSRISDVDKRIEEGRSRLRKAGFFDDSIKAVEDLMQKRGLTDYEAAAALYEKENQQEESIMPTSFGGSSGLFDPPADNPWAEAVKPRQAAQRERAIKLVQNKEINKWFAENKPQRRARA